MCYDSCLDGHGQVRLGARVLEDYRESIVNLAHNASSGAKEARDRGRSAEETKDLINGMGAWPVSTWPGE
jgi:hypothetical protein